MSIQNLLEWQNLVFALPIVLAIILLGLSIFGSLGDHDASVDHDVGVDHDISLGHDVGLDHDSTVHSGDNMPHDFSHDFDHDTSSSIINIMLSVLGIGKIPLSILGFCWLIIFGFTGLCLNLVWEGMFNSINVLVIVSFAVALFTALTLTSFIARGIAKVMPQTETNVEKLTDFINREAEVRYTVTDTFGTITLRDKYGNLQTLHARRDPSCENDILPDTKVMILSYSQQEREFVVIPANQLSK